MVDADPVLNPGLVMVGVVAPALFSAGKNPVADIGTTSKNCFYKNEERLFHFAVYFVGLENTENRFPTTLSCKHGVLECVDHHTTFVGKSL